MRSPAADVHNDQMFNWNDLKYFLAVARHHSTIAAGKSLGLSQSTVHRRVSELEKRIGRQLMTRVLSFLLTLVLAALALLALPPADAARVADISNTKHNL